ncbi:6-carboxytetrahydropterin synthase, partial [candidate division WOR-3 bacterium]|nr:6-carboxytetrahydropterin synthase [candidate division WOR-3 bacterium]
HTYRISIKVRTNNLNKLGMAMDFRRVKKELNKILKKLDHTTLNKLLFFKKHNATAEWVAVYIYNEMKKKIKAITSVTVWEGQDNTVTYYEE